MKVAWWMYNSTDPSQFTMNSPKHCNAVFRSLLDRGHSLVLNHLVRPVPGQRVYQASDQGPFAQHWDKSGFPQYAHDMLTEFVKHALDPQNKAQRAMRAWMDSSDWKPLDSDVAVQYVELFPCVSLRAKLELAHAVLRGVLSGVHTVLCDQDFNASVVLSTIDDMYRLGETHGWSRAEFRKYFHLWTPYVRRMYAGDQVIALPSYSADREAENPLDRDVEVDYHFVYVGNDYQREEQLAKFYKKQHDNSKEAACAIYGRWDLEKYPILAPTVGKDAFMGPVAPDRIHEMYRRGAASIGITHRNFYGPKLVAFRWLEVTEAGRMFYVDRRLQNYLNLFPDDRFVDTPEEAMTKLEHAMGLGYYWDQIEADRERLRTDPRLNPGWTAKALEHYGMDLHAGFKFDPPTQLDVEPKEI
jgi:hypothetical protein